MGASTFMDAPPEDGEKLKDHDAELGDTFDAPPAFTGITFHSRVHNLLLTAMIGTVAVYENKDDDVGRILPGAGASFPVLRDYQNGIQRSISPGFRFEFKGNVLTVDKALRESWRKFIDRYGHYYLEEQDLEELREIDVEDILRTHPALDTNNVDAFREIQAAIPAADGELEKILDAALIGDEDALEKIYDAELGGFKREKVLEAAKRALESIHAAKSTG